jgi:hypothetical protein
MSDSCCPGAAAGVHDYGGRAARRVHRAARPRSVVRRVPPIGVEAGRDELVLVVRVLRRQQAASSAGSVAVRWEPEVAEPEGGWARLFPQRGDEHTWTTGARRARRLGPANRRRRLGNEPTAERRSCLLAWHLVVGRSAARGVRVGALRARRPRRQLDRPDAPTAQGAGDFERQIGRGGRERAPRCSLLVGRMSSLSRAPVALALSIGTGKPTLAVFARPRIWDLEITRAPLLLRRREHELASSAECRKQAIARAGHRVAAASRAGRKRQWPAASGDVLLRQRNRRFRPSATHRVMR